MGKRTRLEKLDHPPGAFVVSGGISNQQSTRQGEISGKKNPRSVVVECQVRPVVSRRRNYVHSSGAQIQVGNPVGPVSETEKRLNSLQIDRHDLDRWKRWELRIASTMLPV